jgi:hypothetical protein
LTFEFPALYLLYGNKEPKSKAAMKPTKQEAIDALEILLCWVLSGDRIGNPYCRPAVKHALRTVARDRGMNSSRYHDVKLRDIPVPEDANRVLGVPKKTLLTYPLADYPSRDDLLALGIEESTWGKELRKVAVWNRIRAVATGEKRPPKAGEWYLSGAIPSAYQAQGALSESYNIVRLCLIRESVTRRIVR